MVRESVMFVSGLLGSDEGRLGGRVVGKGKFLFNRPHSSALPFRKSFRRSHPSTSNH